MIVHIGNTETILQENNHFIILVVVAVVDVDVGRCLNFDTSPKFILKIHKTNTRLFIYIIMLTRKATTYVYPKWTDTETHPSQDYNNVAS